MEHDVFPWLSPTLDAYFQMPSSIINQLYWVSFIFKTATIFGKKIGSHPLFSLYNHFDIFSKKSNVFIFEIAWFYAST